MRGASVPGRRRAARDHTHALFRAGSHSFLGNGATLLNGGRQCSHAAVERPTVIAPDLPDLDLPKPRYLRLSPSKTPEVAGKIKAVAGASRDRAPRSGVRAALVSCAAAG